MSDIKITATGLVELRSKLSHLAAMGPEIAQQAGLEAARLTIDAARQRVPTRSGRAVRSLQAYVSGGGIVAQGGRGIDYYRWLELGGLSGRKHANRRQFVANGRYIQPAYESIRNTKIPDMMAVFLKRAIAESKLDK